MDDSELRFLSNYGYRLIDRIYSGHTQIYSVKKDDVEYALKRIESFILIYYVELDVMARLKSPYVISLHEIIFNPHMVHSDTSKDVRGYYIVMEKALSDIGGTGWFPTVVSDEFLVKAIFEMFCGLSHIHECGIVHGDIKPQNILVQGGILKYTDFGIADYIVGRRKKVDREYKYTLRYRPPELVSSEYIYFASDVWALGCTIYEMIVGERLFDPKNVEELEEMHNSFKGVHFGTTEFRMKLEVILNDCLNKDPERRPTAKNILGRPALFEYQCIITTPKIEPYPVPPIERKEWIRSRERIINIVQYNEPEVIALIVSIVDRYAKVNNYDIEQSYLQYIMNLAKGILGMEQFERLRIDRFGIFDRIAKSLNYKLYTPTIYSVCGEENIYEESIVKALLDIESLHREKYIGDSCDRLRRINSEIEF